MAGFKRDQLEITLEDNQLTIRGRQEDDKSREYIHRGIAARQFSRTFVLADGIEVKSADLSNGLLCIDLVRREPDRLVRKIEIGETSPESFGPQCSGPNRRKMGPRMGQAQPQAQGRLAAGDSAGPPSERSERRGKQQNTKTARQVAQGRRAAGPPVMSMSELAKLGGGKIAYIKVMTADEAKEMFPAIEGLPAGINLFALHAADGTPLALTDSRQAAVGHAMGDELEIASLH